jgi:hypothetical protein
MRRSAQYYYMFEGVHIPSIPPSVNLAFQTVKTVVSRAVEWISKLNFRSSQISDATPPDNIVLTERNDISVRYIPLCSCRTRKLDYATIIYETDGPHYDKDVFIKIKNVYWMSRWRFLRKVLKLWLFDVKEIRPVEVTLFFI